MQWCATVTAFRVDQRRVCIQHFLQTVCQPKPGGSVRREIGATFRQKFCDRGFDFPRAHAACPPFARGFHISAKRQQTLRHYHTAREGHRGSGAYRVQKFRVREDPRLNR